MTVVYFLVCTIPFLIIILTFMLIGSFAARFYRAGRDFQVELKPSVDSIKKSFEHAQSKGTEIGKKSQSLSETFEEMSGRLSFIQEAYEEIMDNPAVRAAGLAGRFRGKK